jgi:pyridoxal phosphate enzyme (YggS family)
MATIAENLQAVKARITAAARASGRDAAAIRLLAVSKAQGASAVREAYRAGQGAFGENYLQEALEKKLALADLPLEWHFIGPIQSNKTRQIAENFSWVHSLDELRIARRLAAARAPALGPLEVCIQVNVSGEASKGGVVPGELGPLAAALRQLPQLRLRGLMAIPAPAADTAAQRAPFRVLRELVEELNKAGQDCDTLSMGMTDDFATAIAEGATIVRIGSAIFGARPPRGAIR